MATRKYKGQEVEIVSVKGGWASIITADGKAIKVRNSAFEDSKPAKASKPTGGRAIGATPVNRFEEYHRVKREGRAVSFDSDDSVARELRGLDLDRVYTLAAREMRAADVAADFGDNIDAVEAALRKRYGKLNAGMQRMNLGNRVRGARSAAKAQA